MYVYDYRSKPGYAEGSHFAHVKGRPTVSYDVARGTHTYVTRMESHVASAYKYPTSHVKVDSSMVNHGRPREVEDFITQILDEVNGPPDLATSSNWGRHSSPVKVYPTRDYGSDYHAGSSPKLPWDHEERSSGLVYDQLPQRDYGIPNKGYLDQSHMKAIAPGDYEAPKKWDRSPYPVGDPWSQYKSPTKLDTLKNYEAPNTHWGHSSIKPHAPRGHQVSKDQWDQSIPNYDDRSPKNRSSEMLRDHGGINNRWGGSVENPHSPINYEVSSNRRDRLPSYDQLPPNGYAGGAPKNSGMPQSPHDYGILNNQHNKSSSPFHDHPTNGNTSGVPNRRWGNSLMKPQSPSSYGVPNYQRDRPSSPIHDHSLPSKNTEGVPGVPSSRWGKSPKGYGLPNNQWDRSLSPIHDHPPPTKNTNEVPSVPSSRWGNSLMEPLSPRGHGVPNSQWDRSLSPDHDHTPPKKNTGGVPDVQGRWVNSMKPQSPEEHGVPKNQWDKSFSSDHNHPPPTKNIGGVQSVPSSRWGNSLVKPQSPKDHGVSKNHWDRSLSLEHNQPPPTKNNGGISGVPSSQWGNSLMKPQTPKGHDVPINQWDRTSSPVHDHPPPTKNNGVVSGVPSSRWGNSLMEPQSPKDHGTPNNQWDRSSNPSHDHPPPTRKTGSSFVKPRSPKNHGVPSHQWDSLNPNQDHPPPGGNTGGVLDNQWPNSPVKSQSPKDYGVPNSRLNKQSSFARDHSPLGGNIGGVPNNRLSDPPVNPPQSPKGGFHQRNRSSSPTPTRNSIGIPNSRLGNSSVNPQSPRVTSSPYDEQIGNNDDFKISKPKPVDYSYDHQPKENGSSKGMKPSGYHSSLPRQTTTPLGKVTNNIEASPQLKVATGRSPDYLTGTQSGSLYPASEEPIQETKVSPAYLSAEAARRYGDRSFPAKRTNSSNEAVERYNSSMVSK